MERAVEAGLEEKGSALTQVILLGETGFDWSFNCGGCCVGRGNRGEVVGIGAGPRPVVACAVFDAGDQRGFELRLVNGRLAVLTRGTGVGQRAGGAAVAAAPGGAHARARHGDA